MSLTELVYIVQIYSAEVGARITDRESTHIQRDFGGSLRSNDGRVWQLRDSEVL